MIRFSRVELRPSLAVTLPFSASLYHFELIYTSDWFKRVPSASYIHIFIIDFAYYFFFIMLKAFRYIQISRSYQKACSS